jgi:hypothetical protein
VSRPEQPSAPPPDPSGQPPPALSFEDEIRATVHYERGLAVKALLSIALVAAVLAFRVYFFG